MKKIFYNISLFCLILFLILSSVFFLSFRKSYYKKMYSKLEVAETIKISEEELESTTQHLLDYIKDDEENLDIIVTIDGQNKEYFNDKEKDHMIDVKELYLTANFVRKISLFISVLGLVTLVITKDYLNSELLTNIFRNVLISYGLIIGGSAIFAVIDFDSFWTAFHQLFFSNDLWLLNPNTDRLIMMVPQEFFMGLVYRIFAMVTFIFALVFTCFKLIEGRYLND